MEELIAVLDDWLGRWPEIALATVVSSWGSTPRPAGSHMAVSPTGAFAGSVSGGCVEGAVVEAALSVLEAGRPQLLEFGVADELAWDVGLACGGRIRVLVEPLANDAVYIALREAIRCGEPSTICSVASGVNAGNRVLLRQGGIVGDLGSLHGAAVAAASDITAPTLLSLPGAEVFVRPYPAPLRMIIIGAVHTAIPLVELAHTAGFTVTVVDARAAFATRARFPAADELVVEWPDDALARLKPDPSTAVVVLTHDPKFDEPALAAALRSCAGYIGAIGSRSTSADRALRLRSLGFDSADIERVHSPIGLDLGAVTPAETALSILSEVVATRYGRNGGPLKQRLQDAAGV